MAEAPMTFFDARAKLRSATSEEHARVDDAFSKFDFGDADSYLRVLRIFGRVVPQLEKNLPGEELWSGWHARASLIAKDLAELSEPLPPNLAPLPAVIEASPWGVQYVLEGSRLGGRVLSQRVGADLPKAYLGDFIALKDWQQFQIELQDAANRNEADWIEAAVAAARAAFSMFEDAAAVELAETVT